MTLRRSRKEKIVGLTRLIAIAMTLLMAACVGDNSENIGLNSTPGWPAGRYVESTKDIVPAMESLAWRIDAKDGPETDIWISGISLDNEQRTLLRRSLPSLSDDNSGLDKLGIPGLFLYVRDDGAAVTGTFTACAFANGQIQCNKNSVGKVVITQLDAGHVKGTFYSDSKDQKIRYGAVFDAPMVNESAAPVPAVVWNKDGGEAGTTLLNS